MLRPLLSALGIVVEILPSETVEDRHTLSPAEAMYRLSRPLPMPLDPDTVRCTCRGGDSNCWRTVLILACPMETGCIPIQKPLGIASIRMESLVWPVKSARTFAFPAMCFALRVQFIDLAT